MDQETRTVFAQLTEAMNAGFARMDTRLDHHDRYFELMQAQHVDLRDRVDGLTDRVDGLSDRVDGLAARVDRLEHQVQALRSEVGSLRDWSTRELGEVRRELRDLRQWSQLRFGEVRADIAELSARVDRLETA